MAASLLFLYADYPAAVNSKLCAHFEGGTTEYLGNPNITLKTQEWNKEPAQEQLPQLVGGRGVGCRATTGTQGCGIEGDGEGTAEEAGTEGSGVLSGQASGRTEVD